MDLNKQEATRKVFLLKLYEITNGDIWADPLMYDIGNALHLDNNEIDKIVDILRHKGFIKVLSKKRDISITAEGIEEAERTIYMDNKIINEAEIKEYFKEINRKLDLLSCSQEIIYDDFMQKFENGQTIQKKDIKMALFSIFASKLFDHQNLINIISI